MKSMKSNKKLSGEPKPSKFEKRASFNQKLNPQSGNSLIKYKANSKDATLGATRMNKGGTTIGIVGGKLGKSTKEMRQETGYSRAQRVKMAAAATEQSKKRVRATSPTKTGAKLRRVKRDVKEAFKKTHKVMSARLTGCGGSAKACKTRQGDQNF
jgi:hypothetical protein